MKKVLILLIAMSSVSLASEGDHQKSKHDKQTEGAGRHFLLDPQDCKETKDGIGYFLGAADELFDDIKLHGDDKNKKLKEDKWRKAAFFSELAANYSTVYQVWCKRRQRP